MPSKLSKMQKPRCQTRLSRFQNRSRNKSNKNSISDGLRCSPYPTSLFSQSSHNCSQLLTLIEQQRFTDCLEHLEDAGCTGDATILVLGNLQKVGGAL